MKMAAAEGICVDTDGAAFTIAQFGSCPLGDDGAQPTQFIKVPGVASFMSHNSFTATSEGVADVQERMGCTGVTYSVVRGRIPCVIAYFTNDQ